MRYKDPLFNQVLWFSRKEIFDLTGLYEYLRPKRKVSSKPRYGSGEFYSEKCDRIIQHESGLELSFIQKHLEGNDDVLFYWDQPVRLPFSKGKHGLHTTLDYGAYLRSGHVVIIEVKAKTEMLDHTVQAKAEGAMEYCCRRGFGYLLTDGRHTPGVFAKGKVNRRLEKELKVALAVGDIRRERYRQIKTACDAKPSELFRAIIRLDLKYSARGFRITRGNQSPVFRQVYLGKKRYEDAVAGVSPDIFELLKREKN